MSASTAAIAASTASTASMNLQLAQRSKCNNIINEYSANTATVIEMQEYADCVQLLHPKKCSQLNAWLVFIICVLAIASGIISSYKEYQKYDRDFADCLLAGFMGFLMAIGVALVIFVTVYGLSLPFLN